MLETSKHVDKKYYKIIDRVHQLVSTIAQYLNSHACNPLLSNVVSTLLALLGFPDNITVTDNVLTMEHVLSILRGKAINSIARTRTSIRVIHDDRGGVEVKIVFRRVLRVCDDRNVFERQLKDEDKS